jgi:hypothetical protein
VRRAVIVLLIAASVVAARASAAEERSHGSTAWIAAVRIIKNGSPSGSGVYLRSGLVITAAHLTSADAKMGVHIAGTAMPATVLKQGRLDQVDLTLLQVDEAKLPARVTLPRMPLCTAPPWPDDPVIVVDAERATRSRIVSPHVLPFTMRGRFSTLIADVASTGNSGSGVFDPNRKCLHGIMSQKIMSAGKDVAKYFVPAAEIRKFMPAKLRKLN